MTRLLTVSEAAQALRVSPGTVYALCSRRELRHERVGLGRGKILVPEDALEEYRRARTTAASGGGEAPEVHRPPARPRPVSLKHLRLRGGG